MLKQDFLAKSEIVKNDSLYEVHFLKDIKMN